MLSESLTTFVDFLAQRLAIVDDTDELIDDGSNALDDEVTDTFDDDQTDNSWPDDKPNSLGELELN